MSTYFCDGLKEVSILHGVARLEFHRLEPIRGGSSRDVREIPEMVVALPIQGFAQALSVLEQVRDQLIREGVLKPAGAPDDAVVPPPPKSPNFA